MKRWMAAIPLLALAGLAILFATFGLRHDPHVNPDALVGKPLPADRLPPLNGGAPVALASTVQGPTLVNVFFSNCVPCVEEHPALLALKAQGVRIVGVAYKEPSERSRAYLQRMGDPFVVALADQDGRAAIDLGATGAPETFLVDAKGIIRAKHVGALTPQDAEAMLEQAGSTAR